MSHRIAAKGYTSVVLVLNMKRFVAGAEARKRFETVRGSLEFAKALQQEWPQSFSQPARFSPVNGSHMTVEDVGFATGVFRSLLLDRHSSPTYALDKEKVTFSPGLESNFQFKTLFKRAWDRWEISIRPTMTGFFIIRLVYRYQQAPRAIIDLAKDAIKLQEPLDVPSAVRWLKYNRERYENEPDKLAVKIRSVKEFLEWLGADVENPERSEMLYYPVQWKLAVEVVNLFVEDGRFTIPHKDGNFQLCPSPPKAFFALQDSFTIYHIDELLAEPGIIKRSRLGEASAGVKVRVALHDIQSSNVLRNTLVSLLLGKILRNPDVPDEEMYNNAHFPSPRWSHVDPFFDDPMMNLANWNDELCFLTERSALIMPSSKWREYEVSVTSIPSATIRVPYYLYWKAIERMIEFVLEMSALARLIERDSYDLLELIADKIEEARAEIFESDNKGNKVIDEDLLEQMARVAKMRLVSALARSFCHPPFWGQSEHSISIAERLFERMDIVHIFIRVEQNFESISNAAEDLESLRAAEYLEKSDNRENVLSLGLAAVSFILTLLVLPSFWYDLTELFYYYDWGPAGSDPVYFILLFAGTILGFCLIAVAPMLFIMAIRRQDLGRLFSYLFNRDR